MRGRKDGKERERKKREYTIQDTHTHIHKDEKRRDETGLKNNRLECGLVSPDLEAKYKNVDRKDWRVRERKKEKEKKKRKKYKKTGNLTTAATVMMMDSNYITSAITLCRGKKGLNGRKIL